MKHLISALVAVALAAGLSVATAADFRIGFVDGERLQRESAPAERASKTLEKEFAPRLQELQRREAQLKGIQSQLEKEAMTMS